MLKNLLIKTAFVVLLLMVPLKAEDGYRLWLRYDKISDEETANRYKQFLKGYFIEYDSPTIAIIKNELQTALNGLLGKNISRTDNPEKNNIIIIGSPDRSPVVSSLISNNELINCGNEGYIIKTISTEGKERILITGKSDVALLYGVFNLLRLMQTHSSIENLYISSMPKIKIRVLNHWDNLDRTVERGYAGFSLWDWHKLPDYIDSRYFDYARANASIGINGTVLTNVNANALVLTPVYLEKVKALADIFRPYGIKVYLTARFSAPIEIGELDTADPLNNDVKTWWANKAKEIYGYIPDFGGFLVKANSEGQPGPQNYNRTHADGANMLADAVKPHGGIVMWRAFVYSADDKEDRAKQAYNEFKPFDGKFRENVLIQVKNGPIDFQPREPFHPLFGAMPQTPLMMEYQITQEYLGQGTSLAYLSTLFKEVLESDTHAKGEGSTVAKIIDGTLDRLELTGIAGVSNIGTDRNWTGHTFGQANWYAFGRLAWNHEINSDQIADEWLRMTFTDNKDFVDQIKELMMNSRETVVNYMTPLGLHHIMGWHHHYGPAPWIKDKHRDDWTSVYYHRADEKGIGFDRTQTGSDAVSQYFSPVARKFSSLEQCPEEYLLWFHHVDWDYVTKSGRTLWDELCYRYYEGAESAGQMRTTWNSQQGRIDDERFNRVKMLLNIQYKEAIWWRNACVLYFQTFSKKAIPDDFEKPDKTLEYYMNLEFPYAP